MSDDKEKEKKYSKDKEKTPDKSTPDPQNPAFTTWIERLFRDDERADFLIVTELYGPYGRNVGEVVRRHAFKSDRNPNKEELVALSNELIGDMQNNTDTHRKPMKFAITAHNAKKAASSSMASSTGGGAFARYTMELEPQRLRIHPGEEGDEIEISANGGDLLRKRAETVLGDGRFYAELTAQIFTGVSQVFMDLIHDARAENKELRASWLAATKQLVEAQDHALDREVVREEKKFMLDAKRKGLNILGGLLPGVVAKVTNGTVRMPGGRAPESMAIESVMDNLTKEEKHTIFGDWTDDGVRTSPGVLNETQVRIIVGILREETPVAEIDKLIQGPDAIVMDQYMAISSAVDMEKLLPLVDVLKDRKAKIEQQTATSSPKAEA